MLGTPLRFCGKPQIRHNVFVFRADFPCIFERVRIITCLIRATPSDRAKTFFFANHPGKVNCVFGFCYSLLGITQRHLLVSAAVVAACLLAAPEAAQASCGDYVIISGQSAHSDASPMAGSHSSSERGIPICRGAGCQQRREVPASSPQRVTLDEHSWGWLPKLCSSSSGSEGALCAPTEQPLRAVCLAAGLFRPPRLTAGL